MAAVTGVLAAVGSSYASFLTPSLEAALTADLVAGQMLGLSPAFQALTAGIRQSGALVGVGAISLSAQPGTTLPYAVVLLPIGPSDPQAYTVAALAAALLATPAPYAAAGLYVYTPQGYSAVTRLRPTVNGSTRAAYTVELEANPVQAGVPLLLT